jgi:hypothetical protein
MNPFSLPEPSLRLLLRDAASRDLPTARRYRLFRILTHERYLTREQLIARVEAHLGRGCFGAAAWQDTFYRDMRLVKQAFAAAGHTLRYSRDPQRPGYYLAGQPLVSEALKRRTAADLTGLDVNQLAALRRLSSRERVQIGASMSQAALDIVAHRIQRRSPELNRVDAQKRALEQYYEMDAGHE